MNYDIIGGLSTERRPDYFTIGNLIELCLEHRKKFFSFLGTDFTVGELHSWRGSYDTPAISYITGKTTGEQIAKSLIADLKEIHYGWKGGEYMYARGDEFYVARPGESSEYKVCGHEVRSEHEVILLTKLAPY